MRTRLVLALLLITSPPLAGLSDFHVSPPSRETYRSEPGPPLISSHGRRRASQNPANTTRGLFGSIATSEHPAYSFLWSTRCHVLPPSVVR